MKNRTVILFSSLLLIPVIIFTFGIVKINKKSPVTLTLWHNYGGQMKDTMDEMIEEFNGTVGKKEGVFINVTSISGSSTLHEKLIMTANHDPGAPELPDITTAYPKTALVLAEKGLLADLDELFSKKEIEGYIPKFIEEGRLGGDHLYVLPTAKSTEVLFVNTTIFNRFAKETGASLEDLRTFEGIKRTAKLYYDWTDRLTPDTKNDGKTFYVADSLYNYSLIGCAQLGTYLIKNNSFPRNDSTINYVWNSLFDPMVRGQYAIFDGYATDLAKTGDIVCSTGSTAGVLFFSSTVTYADNTTEPNELAILPYPVFENGNKVAIQRGAGMSIIKSNSKKEKQAAIFLKWFTSPENNLRFVASTGYLPVTENAFGDIMVKEIDSITGPNIKNLLKVTREMQVTYDFLISPLFNGVDELEDKYNDSLRSIASEAHNYYFHHMDLLTSDTEFQSLEETSFATFSEFLQ